MKKNYLYLILAPFVIWVLEEIFFFEPSFFFLSLSLSLLIIAFSVRSIIKKYRSKFWPALILAPASFYISFSFYSAIIISQFWIQTIFLLVALFIFFYLRYIHLYFSLATEGGEAKLRQLLLIGSFLSSFAFAATLYALPIFLSWSSLLLLGIFIVVGACLFGQLLVFKKRVDKDKIIFWGINVFVLTEFAGIFFLLPLNYNILGVLLAIIFYLLVLFDEWREEDRLNWKNLKWPVVIACLIFVLIFLSARWL